MTGPAPGALSCPLEPPIENGVPEYAEAIPFSCHPWRMAAAAPFLSFMKGSSYRKPSWKTCVRSKPARAKFWSYMPG